jgi:GNAT superfamily N-acetyltransferase
MSDVIRAFRDSDRAAVVAIDNQDLPPQRRYTVADWERWDTHQGPDEMRLRLVAGDPAVGYLEVVDRNTTPSRVAGVCQLDLMVAHAARGQGIGGALYARGLAFAQERGAEVLETWFYQYGPDEPAIPFLAKRGFSEYQRRQTSHLDVPGFDLAAHQGLIDRVAAQGVRIFSYADLPDSAATRRQLFDLYAAFYDLPSFAAWEQADLAQIDWATDTIMIAAVGETWVGLSRLSLYNPATGAARIPFTGTLPEYRGQGIATALKLRALAVLQAQGGQVVLTSNRVDNLPMLAVNRKLGFQPGPVELTYRLTPIPAAL